VHEVEERLGDDAEEDRGRSGEDGYECDLGLAMVAARAGRLAGPV
jgi:hypothetical protein